MSGLNGPCPGLPRRAARYIDRTRRRLVVKSGCGGPRQVSGRSDLDHIENRSVSRDRTFVFKMLGAVVSGERVG
jgi:lipopolysaccharide/colanic/teichoic acid biosynthesis glycosyltransferase